MFTAGSLKLTRCIRFRSKVLFEELARNGHNVTVFAPDKEESTIPNLHFIWSEKLYSTLLPFREHTNEFYGPPEVNPFRPIVKVWPGKVLACEALLSSNGFDTLMNYPESFKVDLLITDVSTGPCWTGFLHKFHYPPTVGIIPYEAPDFMYDIIDGHPQSAYIGHHASDFGSEMTFGERFVNFYAQVLERL